MIILPMIKIIQTLTTVMDKLTDRIQNLIPDGDGYNSEYADTLREGIERIKELQEEVAMLKSYNEILTIEINEKGDAL